MCGETITFLPRAFKTGDIKDYSSKSHKTGGILLPFINFSLCANCLNRQQGPRRQEIMATSISINIVLGAKQALNKIHYVSE